MIASPTLVLCCTALRDWCGWLVPGASHERQQSLVRACQADHPRRRLGDVAGFKRVFDMLDPGT